MRCSFEKSSFGVLSVCTLNNSLNSYHILTVQHALECPFNSVSNDIRYGLYCATFGNHPSSTQTHYLGRSSRHSPSTAYHHDLPRTQMFRQVLFLIPSSFLRSKPSASVCITRETSVIPRTGGCR